MLSATTLIAPDVPGAIRIWLGVAETETLVAAGNLTLPAPNDGGWSAVAVPHCLSGVPDRLKSIRSVPRSPSMT